MDRPRDDAAFGRWLAINAVRIAGVATVVAGLLIVRDRIPAPAWAGYVILPLGLFAVFVAPILLARRWRSPRA